MTHSRRADPGLALAFTLAIGNHFIAADHTPHNRAEALELAIRQLLR